nr:DNA-directed RNA polymerase III subunit RPC9-like [Spinacia oleracea]XP_021842713.1 DNA-directed RNA polymerase III subunit RPC9-like [Spinacia oleracea]
MKILKTNAGPLTNFEVLDLLRSKGASTDPTRVMSLLTPSEFKVYDYLVQSPACDQTRESVDEFLEKSKEYQLAKAEVINILNNRPSSAAELAPIIEALEQRNWDVDTVLDEMAEMIVQILPPSPSQKNMDEEAAEDNNTEQVDDEDNAEENMDDEDNAVADEDNEGEEMDAS